MKNKDYVVNELEKIKESFIKIGVDYRSEPIEKLEEITSFIEDHL